VGDTFKGDWRSPEWEKAGRVHDWRNYVGDELRAMWDTFTDEQKRAIARNADVLADGEEWD
jgi:hypothetical protein